MLPRHQLEVSERIAAALSAAGLGTAPIALERPKIAAHGDLACNVAMQIAKSLKRNPREVAQAIVATLLADPAARQLIAAAEVAGPGFINLRLAPAARLAVVSDILRAGAAFGTGTIGAGRPVLIEFVSADPTGPLHVGHARQAALGDALANLLAAQGWKVTREFYYNDAGVQIDTLATSVQLRARQLRGETIDESAIGYLGDYIAEVARAYLDRKTVAATDGAPVTAAGDIDDLAAIRRFAVASLRHAQDEDLAAFGVQFDNFYLESSLYADRRVDDAVEAMNASGMTFEADGALWLRTTAIDAIGDWPRDDQDRVMRKSDGSYTYFVPDVAYHVAKWERGFTKVINVQGADHHGTVARVRAGLQAVAQATHVAIPAGYPDYLLHKMVRVMRGGVEVKMGKRLGTSVDLRDLLDWVGRDAARFFLVSRKADAEFVFDVDLAQSKSDENPVYYVQYAHARICRILEEAAERYGSAPGSFDAAAALQVDLTPLTAPSEQAMLARLSDYPDMVADAARELAPHHVATYLREAAADLHGLYNAVRVLVDDRATRHARLSLLLATRQVLRNGLALIGVSAPERM